MAAISSTKPYLLRAMHEWCVDNGLTPHLLVKVNSNTKVPMAYVKNGEIVLNLSYSATHGMHLGNDAVTFSARFAGVSNDLYIPLSAIKGIFARENGQGMFFEDELENSEENQNHPKMQEVEEKINQNEVAIKAKKTVLKLVK